MLASRCKTRRAFFTRCFFLAVLVFSVDYPLIVFSRPDNVLVAVCFPHSCRVTPATHGRAGSKFTKNKKKSSLRRSASFRPVAFSPSVSPLAPAYARRQAPDSRLIYTIFPPDSHLIYIWLPSHSLHAVPPRHQEPADLHDCDVMGASATH
jgi:hypothetical protein